MTHSKTFCCVLGITPPMPESFEFVLKMNWFIKFNNDDAGAEVKQCASITSRHSIDHFHLLC